MKKFSKYFDHTLLKASATDSDILKLVSEAVQYDVAAVCVNGVHVRSVRRFIDAAIPPEDSDRVKVAAVAGFPLGAMSSNAKAYEVQLALEDGADEIDLVMNIGKLKSGNLPFIEDEIYAIAEMCHEDGAILKVIIETCLLSDDEIVKACESAVSCGADFVKTSTGFSDGGATVKDVKLMKAAVDAKPIPNQNQAQINVSGDIPVQVKTLGQKRVQIKASGGIRTLQDAMAMIEAGADRLGCSSSIQIIEEYRSLNK